MQAMNRFLLLIALIALIAAAFLIARSGKGPENVPADSRTSATNLLPW